MAAVRGDERDLGERRPDGAALPYDRSRGYITTGGGAGSSGEPAFLSGTKIR
jgi:hypothetical protein